MRRSEYSRLSLSRHSQCASTSRPFESTSRNRFSRFERSWSSCDQRGRTQHESPTAPTTSNFPRCTLSTSTNNLRDRTHSSSFSSHRFRFPTSTSPKRSYTVSVTAVRRGTRGGPTTRIPAVVGSIPRSVESRRIFERLEVGVTGDGFFVDDTSSRW